MRTSITRSTLLVVTSVLVLTLAGCKREKNAPAAPASSLSAGKTAPPQSAPTSAPTTRRRPAPGGASLTGSVLELIDAAGYTYLKVQTASGAQWAAVRKAKLKKGDKVRIVHGTVMPGFKSRTLKRTFRRIVFGRLAKPGEKVGRKVNLASAHSKVVKAQLKFDKPLKRASGANGRTVGQIYAQRKALADKTVSVRGKVTKVNRGILGRNWLHLQDGTSAKGAYDLTVTTKGIAAVGDIVVAKGTVRVDKGFGAGYSYKVMLENAKVTKD